MRISELMLLSKDEVLDFIRKRLEFDEKLLKQLDCYRRSNKKNWEGKNVIEHKRFDMTGFDGNIPNNMDILNTFNDIGIYDYTDYLFINFHEGTPIIYWQYLNDDISYVDNNSYGETTSEIVYKIFQIVTHKINLDD